MIPRARQFPRRMDVAASDPAPRLVVDDVEFRRGGKLLDATEATFGQAHRVAVHPGLSQGGQVQGRDHPILGEPQPCASLLATDRAQRLRRPPGRQGFRSSLLVHGR